MLEPKIVFESNKTGAGCPIDLFLLLPVRIFTQGGGGECIPMRACDILNLMIEKARNRYVLKSILPSLACVFLTGCSGSTLPPKELARDKSSVISLAPGHRSALADLKDSSEVVCLMPAPDYSVSSGFSLAGGGKSLGESSEDLDLGGRSSSVLISREVLFAACTVMRNYSTTPNEAQKIFYKALDAIVDIAKSDQVIGVSPSAGGGVISLGEGSVQQNNTSAASDDATSGF